MLAAAKQQAVKEKSLAFLQEILFQLLFIQSLRPRSHCLAIVLILNMYVCVSVGV